MRQTTISALAVLAALAAAAPAAATERPAAPAAAPTVQALDGLYLVVPAGSAQDTAAAVRAAGGSVERVLEGVGQVVSRLTPEQASTLAKSPAVEAVAPNRAVTMSGMAYDVATDPGSPRLLADSTNVRNVWRAGITGAGVDVAVLDTGVSPVPGLDTPGKVVVGPDLSFDSQDPAIAGRDAYGHGTHMAGLIAGRDKGMTDLVNPWPDQYSGIAPDARIVSIKLGDRTGAVDITQVIAGIDWAVVNRRSNGLNIRVLNLSFGTDSSQVYTADPLAYAAETAWRKGLVVVAAAGNAGNDLNPHAPGLADPAYSPTILAVGASDMRSTASPNDDVVPSFSSRGANGRNPDVVAPGRSLLAPRVPGSTLDVMYGGQAEVGGRFFRGSGSSQAAAVVSGGVALMLQRNPSLTPDQVKAILKATATRLPGAPVEAAGAGAINLDWAVHRGTSGLTVPSPAYASTGFGTLQGSRGTQTLWMDGVELRGEQDIFGTAVSTSAMHGALASNEGVWRGGVFNSVQWTGASWSSNPTWTGQTWGGVSWTGRSWSGRSWSGRSWSGRSWSGNGWTGGSWGTVANGDAADSWSSGSWG